MSTSRSLSDRRKARVRRAIRERAGGKPRLSVFRSLKNIYVQVIDDEAGTTVAAASTLEPDMRKKLKSGGNKDAAAEVTTSAKSFSAIRSQTLKTNVPPGESTRSASEKPAILSGKNIAPNWQHTAAKLPSSNGRSSASAWRQVMRLS